MKKLILYITLIAMVYGCTKGGGNVYVTGRVYNPITGEGIPDIEVRLSRPKIGGTIGDGAGDKAVKRVRTDAEGRYELSHLGGALNTYRIKLTLEPDLYYELGTVPNNSDVPVGNSAFIVDKGKNMEVDFEMVPLTKLKLSINNVNCINNEDEIMVYRELLLENYETWSATNPYVQYGCAQIVSQDFFNILMGEYHFWWVVSKNGASTIYHDTIFIGESEQRVYEINY